MNQLLKYLGGMILGSVVGLIGGFAGIAGGFLILAGLISMELTDTQAKAAGTTLLAILFPISIGAVYEYYKQNNIDIPLALVITFFYVIFAWMGAEINPYASEQTVYGIIALLFLGSSGYFAYKYVSTPWKQPKKIWK